MLLEKKKTVDERLVHLLAKEQRTYLKSEVNQGPKSNKEKNGAGEGNRTLV